MFNFWKSWSTKGISLPFIIDPETKRPSISLMFYLITWFISIISLILLHLNKVTYTATGTSLVFVILGFITYRLRELDKVNVNLKTESISLEDDNIKQEKDNK